MWETRTGTGLVTQGGHSYTNEREIKETRPGRGCRTDRKERREEDKLLRKQRVSQQGAARQTLPQILQLHLVVTL